MPELKKLIFKKKYQKIEQEKQEKIRQTGIIISEQLNYTDTNKIQFILTNALLNFLIVTGCFLSFLSAFEVQYSTFILLAAGAVIALFTAFLYYNNWLKFFGYIISLVGFVYGIVNLRFLIKGGFGYISNHTMKIMETNLNLQLEREYSTYGFEENISVTICMIFIFFAFMLLLNMAITESKGFVLTFLFTFPIVQIGIYFNRYINIIYFAEYFVGLLALFFLKNTNHYHMETKKKKGFLRKKRKNKVVYDYVIDGKFTLSFSIALLVLIMCITTVFGFFVKQKRFHLNTPLDSMKENTRDFTQRLVLVGFWGMMNRNGSAGGVAMNKMGQSRYVSLDYETDLVVNTMFENYQGAVYFKSFNGTNYSDGLWQNLSDSKQKNTLESYELDLENAAQITNDLTEYYEIDRYVGSEKKIEITNIDATSIYPYYPYNTEHYFDKINDDEYKDGLPRGSRQTLYYFPLLYNDSVDEFQEKIKAENDNAYEEARQKQDEDELEVLDREKRYSEYVRDTYMNVPKMNEDVIDAFCKKYNLTKDTEHIVERLQEIFEEDYEYTLMPGITPDSKEFVNYFLDEQKKGYCVYFATASTLIFRHLGIPARYTGGYVYTYDDFRSGEQIDLDTVDVKEWVTDYSEQKYPYGLQKYNIDDSSAHAWVEIYIDGYGWIPVDTTPPRYDREEETPESQGQTFGQFLAENVFTSENVKAFRKTAVRTLYVVLAGIAAVIVLLFLIGIFVRYYRRKNKILLKQYEYLCKCTKFIGLKKLPSMSYREYGALLIEYGIVSEEEEDVIVRAIEKEKFSGKKLKEEESEVPIQMIQRASQGIYQNLSWYKKIIFKYVRWM